MAKAKFQLMIEGEVLPQNSILVIDGDKYCFRGISPERKIRATKSGRSSEWHTFDPEEFEGLEVVAKSTPRKGKTKAPAKAKKQGYSKQRGLDMESPLIKEQAEGAVCSYNFSHSDIAVANGIATITGYTERGGVRRPQSYAVLDKTVIPGAYESYTLRNSRGDSLLFVADALSNEKALIVTERA